MPPSASAPPPPPTPARPRARLGRLILLALLAASYLWFIRLHTSYVAGGSDSSGYMNIARLLQSGELVRQVPPLPGLRAPDWNYQFQQPLGYLVDRTTGRMVTTYPVGLPLHLLAAARFVGLDYAPMLVNVLLAASAAALMFALGRQCGLPSPWALAGAAILWACPLFLLYAIQPMSDVVATVWALAAMVAAVQSRRHSGWAALAGLAFAIGVLVRPSSLLLVLPIAVVLGLRWRAWVVFGLAGLPGAAFLAWYNLQLYGQALTTGYGDVGSLFSLQYSPHNAAHFALWLCLLLSPLVFLPVWGLPALRRNQPLATSLLLWIVAVIAFYVFYYHSGETWWYLRFILPVFPPIIVGALLVMRQILARRATLAARPWIPAAFLAVVLLWECGLGRMLHIADIKHGDIPYLEAAQWMTAHTPSGSIVLAMQASGCLTYYTTRPIVRWDIIDAEGWRRLQAAARAHQTPIYATLFPFEEERVFAACPSHSWAKIADIKGVAIWQLAPDR